MLSAWASCWSNNRVTGYLNVITPVWRFKCIYSQRSLAENIRSFAFNTVPVNGRSTGWCQNICRRSGYHDIRDWHIKDYRYGTRPNAWSSWNVTGVCTHEWSNNNWWELLPVKNWQLPSNITVAWETRRGQLDPFSNMVDICGIYIQTEPYMHIHHSCNTVVRNCLDLGNNCPKSRSFISNESYDNLEKAYYRISRWLDYRNMSYRQMDFNRFKTK